MKYFYLLLLFTTSMWGQSFFDTSLSGGVTSNRKPYGVMELRYNQNIVKGVFGSVSGNASIDGFEYELNLFTRVGLTTQIGERFTTTIGSSFENRDRGFWYYPYFRTDIKIFKVEDEENYINTILDIQQDRIMVGLSFKDIFN